MAASLLKLNKLLSQSNAVTSWCHNFHTQQSPLLFKASQQLWGEPLKKKKRVDPAMVAAKIAKKLKKLDKEIKQLTRKGRQFKPVPEIEGLDKEIVQSQDRLRSPAVLQFDESERRALLHKQWSKYQTKMWRQDYVSFVRLQDAQDEALEELRAESEELYQEALKIDPAMVPYQFEGPKVTPPLTDYPFIDGDYMNISKKW